MSGDASTEPAFDHEPVLRDRVVELFAPVPPGWVVDCTLGGAGHSRAILDAHPGLGIIGLDQDDTAIAAATAALAPYGHRALVRHVRFDHLAEVLADIDVREVSGVLFDLGVSSPQLDRAEHGFSFRHDGPLDMRMDRRAPVSAEDVVNHYSAARLAETLDRYGDERFAQHIAAAIVDARPISTTAELAEVVATAIPAPARRKSTGHPARRTFQAIRIEVNDELGVLATAIDQAIDALMPGGRMVAMSYHSGEDRLVKDRFRQAVSGGCECPPKLPCVCGATSRGRIVHKGAQKASADEIEMNPRSASVRLRVFEKHEEPQGVVSVDAPLHVPRPGRPRLRPITVHSARPTRRALRRRRIGVVFGATMLFGVLFAAAALQVVLIGNQRHLDALQARIGDAREQQYNLRRQETLLRSPQDVADIATSQLGMVAPERAVLVAPAPLLIGVPTTIPTTTVAPTVVAPVATPQQATP